MSQGLFITFEGIEGSGKSTQLTLLRATLEAQGREVVTVREPGSTSIGNRIRGLLLDPEAEDMADETEMLLFAAARSQLVRQVVVPALERGAIVLCDRYLHSSIAYQGWARGLGRDTVLGVNKIATAGLLPHRVVLMDIDVEVALERARARAGLDRIEREDSLFHGSVRQGYLAEEQRDPQRFIRIDADQGEEVIQHQIFERLAPDLAALGQTS
jgi:dTMP kinase